MKNIFTGKKVIVLFIMAFLSLFAYVIKTQYFDCIVWYDNYRDEDEKWVFENDDLKLIYPSPDRESQRMRISSQVNKLIGSISVNDFQNLNNFELKILQKGKEFKPEKYYYISDK